MGKRVDAAHDRDVLVDADAVLGDGAGCQVSHQHAVARGHGALVFAVLAHNYRRLPDEPHHVHAVHVVRHRLGVQAQGILCITLCVWWLNSHHVGVRNKGHMNALAAQHFSRLADAAMHDRNRVTASAVAAHSGLD